jgi:hypothetical protein
MKKHNNLSSEEKVELESKIDIAFSNSILLPRESKIVEFLKNVFNQKDEFKLIEKTDKLEVIELFYYANCPLGFLFVEPSSSFYDYSFIKNRPELELEDYNYFDIEKIIRKTLDENKIDYSELIADDFLECEFFWENKQDLEKDFLLKCWNRAKEKTNSNLYGILYASDMSGCGIDLDKRIELWNEKGDIEVEEYFNGIGINPSKELFKK